MKLGTGIWESPVKQIKLQEYTESSPPLFWVMSNSKIMIKSWKKGDAHTILQTIKRPPKALGPQSRSLWFGDSWRKTKIKLWKTVLFISDRGKDARKDNRAVSSKTIRKQNLQKPKKERVSRHKEDLWQQQMSH